MLEPWYLRVWKGSLLFFFTIIFLLLLFYPSVYLCMIPSNSIVFQTTPNGYTDMLCSPMFDIDTLPGPFPQLGTKSSCVCDRQSRLKWVQEGNHYDAISTQSIGSDSLYRFGRKRCWTHPLIILIYPVVCLPVVRMRMEHSILIWPRITTGYTHPHSMLYTRAGASTPFVLELRQR